jgi:DNA-binding MarR family transcriptional regulator
MQKPTSVADLLSTRLLRLSNTLALYSSRRYRQQFGITLPEWRVMSIVAARDGTTARDISRVLATDKAWVGLSVKSLAKRGYLTRTSDKNDSRRMPLSLTKQGKEMHDAIMAVARQRQRRLLATLSDGAVDAFSANLNRLQAEADKMLDEMGGPNGDDT